TAEHADWDKVIARYEALLALQPDMDADRPVRVAIAPTSSTFAGAYVADVAPRAVHQLLPDIVYGDAISNQARAIREHLRRHGYESEIFVKRRGPRMTGEARLFDET